MKDSNRGFWQVSDIVASSTILACTKECPRDDCRLSCKLQFTTLAAFSINYSKDGSINKDDDNKRQTYVNCIKCGKEWLVDQKGDEILKVDLLEPMIR